MCERNKSIKLSHPAIHQNNQIATTLQLNIKRWFALDASNPLGNNQIGRKTREKSIRYRSTKIHPISEETDASTNEKKEWERKRGAPAAASPPAPGAKWPAFLSPPFPDGAIDRWTPPKNPAGSRVAGASEKNQIEGKEKSERKGIKRSEELYINEEKDLYVVWWGSWRTLQKYPRVV